MNRKIVTVGRYGQKMATDRRTGIRVPIWAGKIYTMHIRQDGVKTWHFDKYTGIKTRSGDHPSTKFIDEVEQWARKNGLEYIARVRHGDMITDE